MILVIIIAAAWIAILGPKLLTRRSRTVGEIGSISHFHRQLRVLEHSAPQPIVAPAYRLRAVDGSDQPGPWTGTCGSTGAPVLSVVGAKELPRPALAFLGESPDESPTGPTRPTRSVGYAEPEDPYPAMAGAAAESMVPSARAGDSLARHRIRRRRRDTLGALTMVFVATVMIGFVPGATMAWYLSAVSGVVLVAYLCQLVHLRRVAEERELKLHYLRPTGAARIPPMASGRYAHPAYRAVASR